jgi:thioredoxin 1
MIKIIKFWASWCAPCISMEIPFAEFKKEIGESNVEFASINVDKDSETTREYHVKAIPFVVFLKDGEIVGRLAGAQTKETLVKEFRRIYTES